MNMLLSWGQFSAQSFPFMSFWHGGPGGSDGADTSEPSVHKCEKSAALVVSLGRGVRAEDGALGVSRSLLASQPVCAWRDSGIQLIQMGRMRHIRKSVLSECTTAPTPTQLLLPSL